MLIGIARRSTRLGSTSAGDGPPQRSYRLAHLVVAGPAGWRGCLAYRSLNSFWAVATVAVYGVLCGGSADPRWHENVHGTSFRSRSESYWDC